MNFAKNMKKQLKKSSFRQSLKVTLYNVKDVEFFLFRLTKIYA